MASINDHAVEGKTNKNNESMSKDVGECQPIVDTLRSYDSANEEEEDEWKRINNETKENLQELRMKIRDLKNFWEIHLQVILIPQISVG